MNRFVVADEGLIIKWLVEADDADQTHAALPSRDVLDISHIVPRLM